MCVMSHIAAFKVAARDREFQQRLQKELIVSAREERSNTQQQLTQSLGGLQREEQDEKVSLSVGVKQRVSCRPKL